MCLTWCMYVVGRSAVGTDCMNNLISPANMLTSGYKSGQDVTKPTSKFVCYRSPLIFIWCSFAANQKIC